ncbi:hypothetical protein F5Y08DRAFT_277826 [Xylaria arbuscula]|nr:hypothetical protein F5Y08DRAFT_277826 [Xylaria arbuscula]
MATEGACRHDNLILNCSPWAEEAGFNRPVAAKRLAATTSSGRNPYATKGRSATATKKITQEVAERLAPSFPGPLLLPFDDLNWDPDYPPQPFRSWLQEPERNKVTPKRQTLYVAAPPTVTSNVSFMNSWKQPMVATTNKLRGTESPPTDECLKFLSVFYHGLPVKFLPQQLSFVPWTEASQRTKASNNHCYVGLAYGELCTRIRTRETPDKKFRRQLNLSDILDAAISLLPDDAYSIVLLVDFDMYEDDEDDFCCGRAYGGSRVCAVSSARYHPALDEANVDHEHMWPTSHCKIFTDRLCAVEGLQPREHTKSEYETSDSPLRQAVEAVSQVPAASDIKIQSGLWFSRVARTLIHELGHCFGMDHCVFYACNMQGTAGMAEDVRQPPYLCPVCLEKLAHAIAYESQLQDRVDKGGYIKERYIAIANFCEAWKHVELFAGYGAWVRARLRQLES